MNVKFDIGCVIQRSLRSASMELMKMENGMLNFMKTLQKHIFNENLFGIHALSREREREYYSLHILQIRIETHLLFPCHED